MSNIYHWEKLTFSKFWFSQKENLKKCTSFKEQKGTRYNWENVYIRIIVFSCLPSAKPCPRFLLNCFAREIKEFLRKWGWFQGHNERFRNILAKNQNFKKLRQDFVDERVLITTTLTSSCHWETLVPFCLRKKKPKNAFLTLNSLVIVSYCKIVQKNKLALQSNNKLAI